MGWRFSRRIRVLPGVRLNFSKSGVSTSFGRRGLWTTIGSGRTRTTIGAPGTGISYTSTSGADRPQAAGGPGILGVILRILITLFVGFVLIRACVGGG